MLYLTLLFAHFLGLVLAVGTSVAGLTLGAASKDLPADERSRFLLRAAVLRKNGSYGLALLILSGLAMFILRGPAEVMAWGGGAFHAKLTLVVILCGVFGYQQVVAKKAREAGGGPLLAKATKLSVVLLGLSLATMLSAVIAFK